MKKSFGLARKGMQGADGHDKSSAMTKIPTKTGKPAQILTLRIDHIGARGDGVGMQEETPVFVPKTAPGDVVEASVESRSAEGIFARLISVKTQAPERQPAPCGVYAQCGGCALQHITPEAYRRWKIDKLQTTLARAGVSYETWEDPAFLPAATRRRVTFSALKTKGGFFFGYHEGRSRQILNIPYCPVLDPALDEKIQALRPLIAQIVPIGAPVDVMLQRSDGAFDLVLTGGVMEGGKFTYDQHEAFGAIARLGIARISHRVKEFSVPEIVLAQNSVLKKFGALGVELPPGAFLQASVAGEDVLVACVVKAVGAAKNIADLFCGTGTFTGHLLGRAKTLYAADSDAAAIDALTKAAQNFPALRALKRNLFKEPLTEAELEKFDCVIFDPPRAGAKEQAVTLAASQVARIVAVSCNPATFARDAQILLKGDYRMKSIKLVDQFVFSAHCELIAVFERINGI
jgi:23S rRNA (uracil1939-C5)-methyltransferase